LAEPLGIYHGLKVANHGRVVSQNLINEVLRFLQEMMSNDILNIDTLKSFSVVTSSGEQRHTRSMIAIAGFSFVPVKNRGTTATGIGGISTPLTRFAEIVAISELTLSGI
jgi:hypothetical protein